MNFARLVLATLLLIGSCGAASAARISQRTTYFTITGSTLEQIDQELDRKGPYVADTGIHHPGTTQVKFAGKVTYQPDEGSCRVADILVTLDLVTTLPRWRPAKPASEQTKLIWATVESDIRRHEKGHAEIARMWAAKMEMALRNLGPARDCAAMEKSVTAVTDRYLARHEEAQRQYDIVEGREMSRRLRRALELRLSKAGK